MVVGCQPYAPAAFTPRKCSWYSFMLEAESTQGPQRDRRDFMSMKNPLTPAGIEPATFQFVAQHLNHCATAVPMSQCRNKKRQQHNLNAISKTSHTHATAYIESQSTNWHYKMSQSKKEGLKAVNASCVVRRSLGMD